MWLAVLRIGVPYVTAALGGTVCERAGVINIALGVPLTRGARGRLGPHYRAASAVVAGFPPASLRQRCTGSWSFLWRGDQIVCGVAMFHARRRSVAVLAEGRFRLHQ